MLSQIIFKNLPSSLLRQGARMLSTTASRPMDFLQTQTNEFFDKATEHFKGQYEEGLLELVKECNVVVRVDVPVMRDNNHMEILKGYRAQHSHHRLPCKGGVNYYPEVNVYDMEAISALMSFKSAIHDIPFGGAQGGVRFDPGGYSRGEINRITRRYIIELCRKGLIGPSKDILATAIGTTHLDMGVIKDTYQVLFGKDNTNAIVTGKPLAMGGIEGRDQACGMGVFTGVRELYNNREFCIGAGIQMGAQGKRVIILGAGQTARWSAHYFSKGGCKVIGMVGGDSGVYDTRGLDVERVGAHWEERGTFQGVEGVEEVLETDPLGELMGRDCDVLITADMGMGIDMGNVGGIRARLVGEAEIGPITPEADRSLYSRGVVVIPDILLSGGDHIISYFEWLKNIEHVRMRKLTEGWEQRSQAMLGGYQSGEREEESLLDRNRVLAALGDVMQTSTKSVYQYAKKHQVSLRTAAYSIAIHKIAAAEIALGITI